MSVIDLIAYRQEREAVERGDGVLRGEALRLRKGLLVAVNG